jgi:hypothetical protein
MKEDINHLKLENDLNEVFNPIIPSNNFIDELHNRLKSKADIIVEYPNYMLPVILIFSGLVLGVALLWVLSKFFKLISGTSED